MKSQIYQIHLSRADYVAGLSAIVGEIARLDGARGRVLFARLGVAVVTLVIVGYFFPYSLPGLFAACLLFWIGDSLTGAAFRTETIGVSFDPAAHSEARLEFSDEGIVEHSEFRTRRWAWDAVRRVHLSPGHVIVELKGWDMIVLPDRLWPEPKERSAFLAELDARRVPGDTVEAIPDAREAEARVLLIEPVLMARISLAVAAFHLTFEALLPFDPGVDQTGAFAAFGVAAAGGAIMWRASGPAFERLAGRSASAAMRIAWALLALLGAAFAIWIFDLI